jgi:hypothetical protein
MKKFFLGEKSDFFFLDDENINENENTQFDM